MLLAEPGSRIEGPTQDVLTVLFEELLRLLLEDTNDANRSETLALRYLARAHAGLADTGHVVRDYAQGDT